MRDEAVIKYSLCARVLTAEQHLCSKSYVKIQTEFRGLSAASRINGQHRDWLALVTEQNWTAVISTGEKREHVIPTFIAVVQIMTQTTCIANGVSY